MTDQIRPKGISGDSYATTGRTRPQRKQAAAFKSDSGYESLLELRRSDPRAFAKLGTNIRLGVAHYGASKRAFMEEHREDGSKGG